MKFKNGLVRALSGNDAQPGPHERLLSLYLEAANAGKHELKELTEKKYSRLVRELGSEPRYYDDAGDIKTGRELLLSEAVESSTLFSTEISGTVIEGASLSKCMREIIPSFKMMGPVDRVPIGGSKGYSKKVAELAEVEFDDETYSYRDFTAFEVAERPSISEKLIRDARWDMIARQIRYAGEKIENKFNYEMLGVLLQNAGLEHDTTGSNQGRKAINGARKLIKAAGFQPDTVIMCSDAEGVLLDEVTLTDYFGAEAAANGGIPAIYGMKPAICDTTTSSSSYTWDYDADGEIGMLVLTSGSSGLWGQKLPLQVKTGEDIVRRIREIVLNEEYAVNYGQANSMCRVKY